ncbi:hypothetical protein [Lentzea sp. NBRC 102530]|uniref:hypothetical protein n=1 Tax=Lentzea sp. NBRC 102530 TaxID=3032201 RepID=UPI0024A0FF90|nr:hypothetical protein [Lentzea sp. NBRC 102530]GLY48619.1 hypothetical protein Lesp01_22750 [Lentzea sp. NBRC 102530]
MTQRGSDQHGFAKDDLLKKEIENELRANGPTRAEAWREPEMPEPDENPDDSLR